MYQQIFFFCFVLFPYQTQNPKPTIIIFTTQDHHLPFRLSIRPFMNKNLVTIYGELEYIKQWFTGQGAQRYIGITEIVTGRKRKARSIPCQLTKNVQRMSWRGTSNAFFVNLKDNSVDNKRWKMINKRF